MDAWIIVVALILAIAVVTQAAARTATQAGTRTEALALAQPIEESFAPSNARDVSKNIATVVQLDQQGMSEAFQRVIEADRKVISASAASFSQTAPDRLTVNKLIAIVLDKVNAAADRRFVQLDLQSVKRESAKGLDRYTINLFVQDHDSRRVHAAAYNMAMQFLVQTPFRATDETAVVQVLDLYFITDHFYNRPLIDGDNPYDRHFRLLNKWGLSKPFHTDDDNVLHTNNKQILDDRNHDLRTPQYRCFEDGGDTVKPAKNGDECSANVGYWDTPVKVNEECPYFMANKNYPNRHGGVAPDGRYCEMPIGMKRVGYRFTSADPAHRANCYNCRVGADGRPGTIGPCCDEQRDRQLYPNLRSPDYAFPSDTLDRGQHWAGLAEHGLSWQAQPTRIQDIDNSKQRSPVFDAIV